VLLYEWDACLEVGGLSSLVMLSVPEFHSVSMHI